MHQIAPKMQHTETEKLKNFWGGAQIHPALGRGTPPPQTLPLGQYFYNTGELRY